MWIKTVLFSLFLMTFNPLAYGEQIIVFMRHGEKPNNDSGQLTCKGFNRALALPNVLIKQFGQPDALFAAAPKQNKLGNSLRSLETINPIAIRLSLPIHLNYHASQIMELQTALLSEQYKNAIIFVVWQHDNLVKIVKNIVGFEGGNSQQIPKWEKDDFDSLYILRINRDQIRSKVIFEQQQQNLNSVSNECHF